MVMKPGEAASRLAVNSFLAKGESVSISEPREWLVLPVRRRARGDVKLPRCGDWWTVDSRCDAHGALLVRPGPPDRKSVV